MKYVFSALPLFLIALSIFFTATIYAQQTDSKQSVGFYLNYLPTLEAINSTTIIGNDLRIFSLNTSPEVYLGFSLTAVNKANWFNEYSIIGLHYRKEDAQTINYLEDEIYPIAGENQHTMNFILRWEKGKYFIQSKNLHIGCSMGISPQFHYSHIKPKVSSFFPFSIFQINNRLNLIPRLKIDINERLAMITKIPLEFMTATWEYTYYDNPAQPLDERRNNNIMLDLGLRPQVNVGITLSL